MKVELPPLIRIVSPSWHSATARSAIARFSATWRSRFARNAAPCSCWRGRSGSQPGRAQLRAAVDLAQQSLRGELVDITANGRRRGIQGVDQFLQAHELLLFEKVEDEALTLLLQHGLTRPVVMIAATTRSLRRCRAAITRVA